ncbi:MAG TPA: prepilin-type N-terminal cleavage/methylation domain-containing protein [Syntrophomonadaceae bacterium]|jgi:prepilin-type N-terminal cleavage/methylation domain-containing protein|nr:prepilin-type N-terminal cleavage/methylation domain-containing protein [Syntrophomonadaceae bacterium]
MSKDWIKGFSLIEVLLTLALISLLLASFITVNSNALHLIPRAEKRQMAVDMAASLLEEIRAHPHQLVPGLYTREEVAAFFPGWIESFSGNDLELSLLIQDYDRQNPGNLMHVRVTVSWDGCSEQQSFILATVVSTR